MTEPTPTLADMIGANESAAVCADNDFPELRAACLATAALLRRLSNPSDEMLDAASKAFKVALMGAPDQGDDESDEAWGVEIGRLGVRAALSALLTGEASDAQG